MTKVTKTEKILRKATSKWENFLAEGAFKKQVDEDALYFGDDAKDDDGNPIDLERAAPGTMWKGKPMQIDDNGQRYIVLDNGKRMYATISDEYYEEGKVNEMTMGERGMVDAQDGNPPSKIGHGNEEYMAAFNAVMQKMGKEPLPIVKPDQKYLDALQRGNLEERDAGMEVWMEKFKLHMRLPQNQPMDEFMKDNAMYAFRQGMDPKQAAEELRAASAERDFPESGMELYDIDEAVSGKEQYYLKQQNRAKGAAMALLDSAEEFSRMPSTEPASSVSSFVERQANIIVDAMVALERMITSDGIDEKKNLKEEIIEDFEIELEGGLTFADVEEAGLVTPGVDSVIDNGDGYAQVYSEPGAMAKMAKTLQAMTGIMVSPKSHGPVDEEMSKKDFVRMVRDKGKVPDLKGDMGPISGLEGPFQYRSGAVLYYDPREGKYYDRGQDRYLDDQEAAELTMEDRTTMSSDPEMDQVMDIAADMLELGARSRIPVSLVGVESALQKQGFDTKMEKGMLIIDDKYVVAKKDSLPATAQKISFTKYAADYLSNLQGEQQDLPLG